MKSVRTYGKNPYQVGLLHGGPGASGEMKPVAEILSRDYGVLELLQTRKTIQGQLEEVCSQLTFFAENPVVLIGFSWGAWLGLLFAGKYPHLVKKLILVGSGSFEEIYNEGLMQVRMNRLSNPERLEAEKLISMISLNNATNSNLRRFGELMSIADSFDYMPLEGEIIDLNIDIHNSIWQEASKMRKEKELIKWAEKVECPVIAFHGENDPHPINGVEKPLAQRISDFKMIRLKKCGHIPWKERFARNYFFELLMEEIASSELPGFN